MNFGSYWACWFQNKGELSWQWWQLLKWVQVFGVCWVVCSTFFRTNWVLDYPPLFIMVKGALPFRVFVSGCHLIGLFPKCPYPPSPPKTPSALNFSWFRKMWNCAKRCNLLTITSRALTLSVQNVAKKDQERGYTEWRRCGLVGRVCCPFKARWKLFQVL